MTIPADPGLTAGDRELVTQFLATRDENAFRDLYRAHTPYLWALAVRLCGGVEPEAEEIVQETWVRSVRLLPRFSWGSALRTWLAGILINCSREGRKLARRYVDSSVAETSDRTAPHSGGLSVDLDRAIGSLNEEMRTVLLLFDLEGYSHEEIAGILGIPQGTSKSRLFVARRILRERLNQDGRNLNDTP